jgi:hypothetical protein
MPYYKGGAIQKAYSGASSQFVWSILAPTLNRDLLVEILNLIFVVV